VAILHQLLPSLRNKAYVPPPPLDELPVTIKFELEAGAAAPVLCPVTSAENATLITALTSAGQVLLTAYPKVIGGFSLEPSPIDCKPETPAANASISYLAAIIPAKGNDLQTLLTALSSTLPPGSDLCAVTGLAAICDQAAAARWCWTMIRMCRHSSFSCPVVQSVTGCVSLQR